MAQLADWQLTATLTFDPKRRPVIPPGAQRTGARHRLTWPTRLTEAGAPLAGPMTRDVAERFVMRWLRTCERAYGAQLTAIAALEFHKNGWPHFHALVHKPEPINVLQVQYAGDVWRELAGFCRLEVPRSVEACAAYAAKYLTKDLARGTVLLWPAGGAFAERVAGVP